MPGVKLSDMFNYHDSLYNMSQDQLRSALAQCAPATPAGIEAEKAADRTGEFIVWNPSSGLPPKVRFETQEQAEVVASDMARRYGEVFYVAQLVARVVKAEPPVELTRLTKKGGRK